MTKQHPRLDHALRNESACDYLNQSGDFPDWVITTAFYSALHFIRYKIFPITIDEESFETLDEYTKRSTDKYGKSAHSLLRKLLNKKFKKNLAAPYSELFDSCHNARYCNYNVEKEEVANALDNLAEIKKYCNTNKSAATKTSEIVKS